MEVVIKERENHGLALAKDGEVTAGQMTYSIPETGDFIIIDHTEVEPDYSGKNVGRKMLNAIVNMAREKQLKILPLCPFANSVFKKDASIRDVLKD